MWLLKQDISFARVLVVLCIYILLIINIYVFLMVFISGFPTCC